eukprot:m.73944 g.73944  ORF g.73944 m.73944 type:complete len:433 (+) comp13918_c0_seq7:99-1397(+)
MVIIIIDCCADTVSLELPSVCFSFPHITARHRMWQEPARWEWEDDQWESGNWVPYDTQCSALLEEAYAANQEQVDLNVGFFAERPGYAVFLSGWFQVNLSTSVTRRVRRGNPRHRREAHPEAEQKLHSILTSTNVQRVVATDTQPLEQQQAEMDEASLLQLFRQHVQDVDDLRDWSGLVPVTNFFHKTYSAGLPIYAQQPELNRYFIQCFRVIIHQAAQGKPAAIQSLTPLAEAFQSCQAEQGREINRIYGVLTGRDKSLPEQIAAFIDTYKQNVMYEVINKRFEATEDNGQPHKQVPHILSRCLVDVGEELGLSGIDLAEADPAKPGPLSLQKRSEVVTTFRELFSIKQLLEDLTSDINQSGNVERAINRSHLLSWKPPNEYMFLREHIFYDEDRPELYNNTQPGEGEEYEAFVFPGFMAELLLCLFGTPQ